MGSNAPFTFPPPPPPPPKALALEPSLQNGYYGGQNRRSRGGSGMSFGDGRRGGNFSRGRGNYQGRKTYENGPASNYGFDRNSSYSGRNEMLVNGTFQRQAVGSHGYGRYGQDIHNNQNPRQGPDSHPYGESASLDSLGSHGQLQPVSKRPRLSNGAELSGLPGPTFFGVNQNHNDQTSGVNDFGSSRGTRSFRYSAPRPVPAPSVPSFLSGLPGMSLGNADKTGTEAANPPKSKKRTTNTLGLTPNVNIEDREESEDGDEDEEINIASSVPRDKLVVTYKGRTANLSDPAELAAWIEERRRKFPTKAKAEEKLREREKQRLEYQAAREAAIKERNTARDMTNPSQNGASGNNIKHGNKSKRERRAKVPRDQQSAKSKGQKDLHDMEKAREKALRKIKAQQHKLKLMEEALLKKNGGDQEAPEYEDGKPIATYPSFPEDEISDISGSDLIESDDYTSSSGSSSSSNSSDSDSDDSVPEESSSRLTGPIRVPPPAREKPKSQKDQPRPCKFFAANGHCRQGKRCRYAHVAADGKIIRAASGPRAADVRGVKKGRISLWQRLVDKEKEDEEARIVDTIKFLGEKGMLNDP